MDDAVDAATFRALQESAGREFTAELVATFLDEAPGMLAALRDALAARDEPAFRRAAHSLKSNGLTFGAVALAARARELETGAHDAVARGDSAAVDRLSAEADRAGVALRKLADG